MINSLFSISDWIEKANSFYEEVAANPGAMSMVLQMVMLVFHVLGAIMAIGIVTRCGRSLLRGKIEQEIWGYFCLPDGTKLNLIHWENTIGRAKGCDVVLRVPSVSRSHAVVTREDDGHWTVFPLNSKNGILVNGIPVTAPQALLAGDQLELGTVVMTFYPSTREEEREQAKRRTRPGREISPTATCVLITIFMMIMAAELVFSMDKCRKLMLMSFGILCGMMWGLYFLYRIRRRTGFEVESLAFFLTSLSLIMTATKLPETLLKQTFAVIIGLFLFFVLSLSIRDLEFAKKLRWPLVIGASGMLAFNVLFGARLFGARNWVAIGPISFQPSELVKIIFVIAGAATLDRLFSKRNLIGTIVFSAYCVGCLALMSDFGTALIFFVAFLVIAFLRTGDLPSVAMVVAAAVFACLIIVKYKPYIVSRFSVWRHVWEDPSNLGYQQTRTMSAIASGGLFGSGAGSGWLKNVAASTTDLVFGVVSEELGLIVAVCAVSAILVLCCFAVKSARRARSSFYVICANAVAAMFLVQSMLNIFGSTDILPLTGVTLPFVSTGGSSMMSCWALLAYIKAADTRQNSGLAVRLPSRKNRDESTAAQRSAQPAVRTKKPVRVADDFSDEDQTRMINTSPRARRGTSADRDSTRKVDRQTGGRPGDFEIEFEDDLDDYDEDYEDFRREDDEV